ncbi:hypothetical protein GGR56DRAFT_625194 [Xylariaceae sp. FL0804]|nr:hypothetical protein GGR56DRAFT_625194 [Xylariaceae sp. FL0804]
MRATMLRMLACATTTMTTALGWMPTGTRGSLASGGGWWWAQRPLSFCHATLRWCCWCCMSVLCWPGPRGFCAGSGRASTLCMASRGRRWRDWDRQTDACHHYRRFGTLLAGPRSSPKEGDAHMICDSGRPAICCASRDGHLDFSYLTVHESRLGRSAQAWHTRHDGPRPGHTLCRNSRGGILT